MNTIEHSSAPHSEYSGRVMLVDDHDMLREMLHLALQTAGFDVVEAGTPLEVVRLLRSTRPDALVIDLQRSRIDGLNLLVHLREHHPVGDLPIVFLAGSEEDDFRWQALQAGADWFGLRPLGMIELQSIIRTLIHAGRPGDQLDCPTPIARLKRTG